MVCPARPQNGCCSSRSRPSSRACRVTGAAPWPAGSWAPAWRGAPIVPRRRPRAPLPGSPVPPPWRTPGTPGSPPRPIALTPPTHPRRAPPVIRPLACGADLRRGIRAPWTGGPLAPGQDAAHRRDAIVLLRMSVLYRGAALPVATPPRTPARGLFITHKSNRHVDPEEHAAGATTSPHYHPTGANHARSFAPPARHRRCGPESPPTVRSSGLPAAESAGLAGDAASGGSCRTGPAMRGALRPPSTPPPHPDALRRSATPTAVRRHNRRPAHAATVRRFPGAPVRSDSRFSLRNDSAQSATGYGASARPGARRPRLSRPAWSTPPTGAR